MSDRRWDNPDWHEGMTLPSRKNKHKNGRKKKSQERTGRGEGTQTQQPDATHSALQEIQQAQAEATATAELQKPREIGAEAEGDVRAFSGGRAEAEAGVRTPRGARADARADAGVSSRTDTDEQAPSGLHTKAEADARVWRETDVDTPTAPPASEASAQSIVPEPTARSKSETRSDATTFVDDELISDEADQEGDLQPFFSRWQRVLIWSGTILVVLFVLAWGKIGYVHHVPDLVRQNVTAYDRGPAFLIIKPWWFGPPVIDLTEYTRSGETPDWDIYRARLGDYAGVVDNPEVLWYFQEDILP